MKRAFTRLAISALLLCWLMDGARAADESVDKAPPDKSVYNLLNPTPEDAMREMSPDRPDKTESPYTVDAGHFMLEMDFVTFTHDDTDGVRTETWNVTPVNLKVGLLNNVDLQLIYDNYIYVRTEDRLGATTQSGFGDLTPRLKINLWGNDGGDTAFALLPFVKFPVNTDRLGNDAVEGGMILPLAVKLPAQWDMGLEAAASEMRNEESPGHHAEFIQSITFDHAIVGKLSGYCEFFSDISTEGGPGWIGTVDVGLEYLVTENVQLDCGGNFGVTRAADDVNVFTGITVRF
jgi:outer membrane putative beta-barrel porin/alpha-amylase